MIHHPLTPGACCADPTCDLGYIGTALGRRNYGTRRMCTYVRALIAGHSFPRPLPTLRRGHVTIDVIPSSVWLRSAVDNWLHDFLPPDAAAALTREAQRAAAATMDTNAGNLRLVSSRS